MTAGLEPLAPLFGTWTGTGSGHYPTIDAFQYRETLTFEPHDAYPLIHYAQRAFLLPGGDPSHWECGFLRPQDDGTVQISNAQDGGRVEVLAGRPEPTSDGLRLEVRSVHLGNDPRLVETRRILTVTGDTLRYVKSMATNTTDAPALQQHLEAVLRKSD